MGHKGPVLGATVVFDMPCLFSETIPEAHAKESMDARLPSSLWILGASFLFEFIYRKLIHTGPFYWMLWKAGQSSFTEGSQGITRWFQNVSNVFGIFIPGEMIPFWRAYFSDGLKPPRMSASLWFTLFSWLLKERRSGRAWRWLEKKPKSKSNWLTSL